MKVGQIVGISIGIIVLVLAMYVQFYMSNYSKNNSGEQTKTITNSNVTEVNPIAADVNLDYSGQAVDDKVSSETVGNVQFKKKEELIQIRKIIRRNGISSFIDDVNRGLISLDNLSEDEKEVLYLNLTKDSTPSEFSELLRLNILNLNDVMMYQDGIINNDIEDASVAENWAIEKLTALEQYGANLKELKRTLDIEAEENSYGLLDKASSLGMVELFDFLTTRDVRLHSSSYAWAGLIVNKKGQYVTIASKLIELGIYPNKELIERSYKYGLIEENGELDVLFRENTFY